MHKQPSSRFCFLCGVDNPIGLKLSFYDDDQDRVVCHFTPHVEHQGYPGVLHGGITSALLDETIGRTLVKNNIWAMTVQLNVKFHQPIPLGQKLTIIGEITRLRSRTLEGSGQLLLSDGSVGASAEAKYYRLADDQIEQFRAELGSWEVVPDEGQEN